MPIINLKKFYYPYYTEDTFVEVSDKVAETLLMLRRQENNCVHKIWYHKAYFSLDCTDGIENHALNWEQPSPEEILIREEETLLYEITLEHLKRGHIQSGNLLSWTPEGESSMGISRWTKSPNSIVLANCSLL